VGRLLEPDGNVRPREMIAIKQKCLITEPGL
jgi:hypothetical protein